MVRFHSHVDMFIWRRLEEHSGENVLFQLKNEICLKSKKTGGQEGKCWFRNHVSSDDE